MTEKLEGEKKDLEIDLSNKTSELQAVFTILFQITCQIFMHISNMKGKRKK